MGIYDRDYWKEHYNKQNGYTEKSSFRRSPSGTARWYSPKQLRRNSHHQSSSAGTWAGFLWRINVGLFAIYGFLTMVKKSLPYILQWIHG